MLEQNQAWPYRAEKMKYIFNSAFNKKPIKGLEIGVWYGVGSTKIWLENCAPNSEFYLIDKWMPYSSEEDFNSKKNSLFFERDNVLVDAFLSAYLSTKKICEERKQDNIKLNLTRGDSNNYLKGLKSDYFDFIYIDGDHKYQNMVNDIREAKRIVNKDFGMICGDDLEHFPCKELYEFSKLHPNHDFISHPVEGKGGIHPGVLSAIYEEFKDVNMLNGFWWIVCQNSSFTTEVLKPKMINKNEAIIENYPNN